MKDVIIGASLNDKQLQDSINKALSNAKGQFNDFATSAKDSLKQIEEASAKVGTSISQGVFGNMKAQISELKASLSELKSATEALSKEKIGGVNSNGVTTTTKTTRTKEVDEETKAKRLQVQKERLNSLEAKRLALEQKTNLELEKGVLAEKRKLAVIEQQKSVMAKSNSNANKNAVAIGDSSYDSAMEMSTNSIQERINKIKALQTVQKNLSTTDSDYATKLKTVNKEISNLKKANTDAINSGIELKKRTNSLAQAWENLTKRVLFYFSLRMVGGFFNDVVRIRAEYEMLDKSLGVLVDNTQKGSQIFEQLKQNALKSPFTIIDLGNSAKQLAAYNFSADELVDTTRRLADISAALGVPMERLTYNLGQIKAQTVLTARDARDFANAGLAIVPELAKMYSNLKGKIVSTGDVMDMMSKKQVSYNDVMEVLIKMTDEGGKFYDFQAKQAQTLQGQVSNLHDAYNNMMNDIGQSQQGFIVNGIKLLRTLMNNWQDLVTVIQSSMATFAWMKWGGAFKEMFGVSANIKQTIAGVSTLNGISQTDWSNAISTNNLTKSQTAKLLVLNRTDDALKRAVISQNLLTEAQVKGLTSGSKMTRVFTQMGIACEGLGAKLKVAIGALKAFAISFIAIEAISRIWEFFSTAGDAAKSAGDKAKEASKSFNELFANMEQASSVKEKIELYKELAEKAKEYFGLEIKVPTGDNIKTNEVESQFKSLKNTLDELNSQSQYFETLWGEDIRKTIPLVGSNAQEAFKNASIDLDSFANLVKNQNKNIIGAIESSVESGKLEDAQKSLLKSLTIPQSEQETTLDYIYRIANAYKELGLLTTDRTQGRMKMFYDYGVKSEDILGLLDDMNNFWNSYNVNLSSARSRFKDLLEDMHIDKNLTEEQKTVLYKGIVDKNALDNNLSETIKFIQYRLLKEDFGINIKVRLGDVQQNLDTWSEQTFRAIKKLAPLAFQELAGYGTDTDQWQSLTKKFAGKGMESISKTINESYKAQKASLKIERQSLETQQKKGSLTASEYKERKKILDENERQLEQMKLASELAGNLDVETSSKKSGLSSKKDLELEYIKDEIKLINELTSKYNTLTKAGFSQAESIAFLYKQYGTYISVLNKRLSSKGLSVFNINQIDGKSNKGVIGLLSKQLKQLSSAKAQQEVDVTLGKLKLDARVIDITDITESLSKSLKELENSYQLGSEFNKSPELEKIITRVYGLEDNQIIRNVDDLIDAVQREVERKIGQYNEKVGKENAITESFYLLTNNLQDWAKKNGIELSSSLYKALESAQSTVRTAYGNSIREVINNYNKLMESYGSYAYQIKKIEKTKNEELSNLNKYYNDEKLAQDENYFNMRDAIIRKATEQVASVLFTQFKESDLWQKAFENLENVSSGTLRILITKFEEFGNANRKNWSTKEAKEYYSTLRTMREELDQRNPFKTLSNSISEYKRLQGKIKAWKGAKDLDDILGVSTKSLSNAKFRNTLMQKYSELSDKKQKIENGSLEVDKQTKKQIEYQYELIKKIVDLFDDEQEQTTRFAKSWQTVGDYVSQSVDLANDLLNTFVYMDEETQAIVGGISQSLKSLASIDVTKPMSIVQGAVGFISGVFNSIFGSKDAKKVKQINKSIKAVNQLQLAYENLQRAVEQETGSAEIGLKKQLIANKKLQLAELQRQLQLEQSRSKKKRDEDKIESLKSEINSLQNDIDDLTNSIVTNLMGTDVKSAAEDFAQTWIDAFVQGEDAMQSLTEKFDDMLNNMIVKAVAAEAIKNEIQSIFDYIQTATEDNVITPEEYKGLQALTEAKKNAIDLKLKTIMDLFGIEFGSQKSSSSNLSGLQKGIQSVTETTAGAIEAYMNSINAQVYQQTALLNNISQNCEMNVANNSQLLLSLRESYQVQRSILMVLDGAIAPNGSSFRVSLID